MDHGGGAVELVIPARILDSDIPALVIEFVGDICVSRRYAGEPKLCTFLMLEDRKRAAFPKLTFPVAAIVNGWECLAVEVNNWMYRVAVHLEPLATHPTGWACDLCQDDRGAVHRASVGFLDLRFYRKADFLPTTRMYHTLLARYMRFEDKNICGICEEFAYYENICRKTYAPVGLGGLTEDERMLRG